MLCSNVHINENNLILWFKKNIYSFRIKYEKQAFLLFLINGVKRLIAINQIQNKSWM